jgi:anti-sigma factor RsiW
VNHARAQELLSAYLEHDVGEAERAALDTHLGACVRCAVDLEDLRDAVDLLRRLPDPEPPPFLATRVMARISAGETRVPTWRRWLEQLGAPVVAAPLAAAAAALAVFSFAAPRADTQPAVVAVSPAPGASRELVARPVGPTQPAELVAAQLPDPRVLALSLRGANHPHSPGLAAHFDHPVRAVAYQPR